MSELRTVPLDGPFGVEVLGIDARSELSRELEEQLRKAWYEHSLLLFRGQELAPEEQLRFAGAFGEIQRDYKTIEDGYNYVSNVSKDGLNPFGPLGFHSDHSMFEDLLLGIMLYGIEVPPEGAGGDTLYASARLAYAALPAALRARIATLQVRHAMPDLTKGVAHPGIVANSQQYDRPVAFTHPVTAEKLLFLSRRHADRILDLSPDASRALIAELSAYIDRPEIRYRHVWKPGDLIIWDNIALQHGRTDFDRKWKRHLRRLQIATPKAA